MRIGEIKPVKVACHRLHCCNWKPGDVRNNQISETSVFHVVLINFSVYPWTVKSFSVPPGQLSFKHYGSGILGYLSNTTPWVSLGIRQTLGAVTDYCPPDTLTMCDVSYHVCGWNRFCEFFLLALVIVESVRNQYFLVSCRQVLHACR